MRVLIVNRHRDQVVGGSEIQCDLLARRLQVLGHTVGYAVMQPRGAPPACPYECFPLASPVSLTFGRVLLRVRPDIVYWRFNKSHLLASVLQAHALGAAFLFAASHDDDTRFWPAARVGGGPPKEGSSWKVPLRLARRALHRAGSCVNFLGHSLVDGHVVQHRGQARGLAPETTRVIRSSVLTDVEPFRWERPFVVWVANVKQRKRPELFLDLARSLVGEPIDFLAVGALQDERYRYLTDRARLPANFHFLGARTPAQVNGIIAASLFLVLTCEPEGFPNVLMQAWNQARPTLSLAYDPDDLIRTGSLGYVEDSPAALAERTRALLADPSEREAISERARRFASETFSLETNARLLEEFLGELVARRR